MIILETSKKKCQLVIPEALKCNDDSKLLTLYQRAKQASAEFESCIY